MNKKGRQYKLIVTD